jgi:hypothetical protein
MSCSSSTIETIRAVFETDAGMQALVARYAPPGADVVYLSSADQWVVAPGPAPFNAGRLIFSRGGSFVYELWDPSSGPGERP